LGWQLAAAVANRPLAPYSARLDNFLPSPSASLSPQEYAGGRLLTPARATSILKAMEVHFASDIEAQLQRLAMSTGTDAEQLVKDAALRLLQEDVLFRAAVRKGIEQADRGEFIEEEEMNARVERMFQS
jgi:predicted transcriptional regulator